MSRNVYIDCGANLGQGFERLKRQGFMRNTDEIFMFEPLPNAYNFLCDRYKEATIYSSAVWVRNEEKIFSIEKATINNVSEVGHASNLLGDTYRRLDDRFLWEDINIRCIDFHEFLVSNFSVNDNIFLKLDIEGAEYAVLDQLIETKSLDFIKTINIEFHGHLLAEQPNADDYYIQKIKEKNITIIDTVL